MDRNSSSSSKSSTRKPKGTGGSSPCVPLPDLDTGKRRKAVKLPRGFTWEWTPAKILKVTPSARWQEDSRPKTDEGRADYTGTLDPMTHTQIDRLLSRLAEWGQVQGCQVQQIRKVDGRWERRGEGWAWHTACLYFSVSGQVQVHEPPVTDTQPTTAPELPAEAVMWLACAAAEQEGEGYPWDDAVVATSTGTGHEWIAKITFFMGTSVTQQRSGAPLRPIPVCGDPEVRAAMLDLLWEAEPTCTDGGWRWTVSRSQVRERLGRVGRVKSVPTRVPKVPEPPVDADPDPVAEVPEPPVDHGDTDPVQAGRTTGLLDLFADPDAHAHAPVSAPVPTPTPEPPSLPHYSRWEQVPPHLCCLGCYARSTGKAGHARWERQRDDGYHALVPGAEPVATAGGSRVPLYREWDIAALQSREDWAERGRAISPGEVPVKIYQGLTPLYGPWQVVRGITLHPEVLASLVERADALAAELASLRATLAGLLPVETEPVAEVQEPPAPDPDPAPVAEVQAVSPVDPAGPALPHYRHWADVPADLCCYGGPAYSDAHRQHRRPSTHYILRPGAVPVATAGRSQVRLYEVDDLPEVRSRTGWARLGKRIRRGEQPWARVSLGSMGPCDAYAPWQLEEGAAPLQAGRGAA